MGGETGSVGGWRGWGLSLRKRSPAEGLEPGPAERGKPAAFRTGKERGPFNSVEKIKMARRPWPRNTEWSAVTRAWYRPEPGGAASRGLGKGSAPSSTARTFLAAGARSGPAAPAGAAGIARGSVLVHGRWHLGLACLRNECGSACRQPPARSAPTRPPPRSRGAGRRRPPPCRCSRAPASGGASSQCTAAAAPNLEVGRPDPRTPP
jgi:hypothetical protein